MKPSRAVLVGVVFIVIAVGYLAFQAVVDPAHIDLAGFTLLIALGAAMSIMAYVLFAGLQRN